MKTNIEQGGKSARHNGYQNESLSVKDAIIWFVITVVALCMAGNASGKNLPGNTNKIIKQQLAEDPATPTAYDITMTPLVQASSILPLNASSANGNIVMYSILSVPSLSQGELSIDMNGTLVPVSEGMMLTADLAANLYFIPEPSYSGNVVFT